MAPTTVTATYLKPNGDPATGRVEFRLVAATYHDGLDAIFPTVGVTGVLDNAGVLSVELEPTSGVDAAFDATDMTYQVTERVTGAGRDVYYVDIPTAPSVDLGTLATYDDPPELVRQFVTPDLSTLGFASDSELAASLVAAKAYATSDLGVFRPEMFGACPSDGSTDVYNYVNGAMAAVYSAGGGIIDLKPGKVYRCDTALTVPGDGTTPQKTVPIFFRGGGARWSGRNTAQEGGAVLDLRVVDTYGKIKTNSLGLLRFDGVTFTDTAGTSTPFIYTTNGTLHIRGCGFWGSKTSAWDQDAIVMGGTNAVEGGQGWTDGFQGYGTIIEGNYFAKLRRAAYGRMYFNGNVIRDNTIWASCGYAAGSAIELNGAPVSGSNYSTGNMIAGNLIECVNYQYGIKMDWALANTLVGNTMFDPTAGTAASIYLGANTLRNTIIHGYGAKPVTDLGGGNTIISTTAAEIGKMGPTNFPDTSYDTSVNRLKVTGAGNFVVQPDLTLSDATTVFRILRSAAEASNPGANVFEVLQRANINVRGAQAGNIQFSDAAGTAFSSFTGGARNWNADGAGGAMQINSGTGGSYLTLRNFGVKLVLQDGTNTVTIKQYAGNPETNLTANPGSLVLSTTGGTGATLYIKESGTGNTGWVAK